MNNRAQKIVDQVRNSGGNFIHLQKFRGIDRISINIYIHYSASGWTAKGAVYAYHPKQETVIYTCSCRGCGYSKKDELTDLILSSGLASFPEVQQALGARFCVGSGTGINKLRDAGFEIVEM